MGVRMKDIARDLNVSVITVSKALRNHADISEATRKRVIKRAKELNYRPNLAARALVTGRTFAVGLVVPDLVHPFFAEVAKSLLTALRQHGYSLVIASSEEDPSLEAEEILQLLARDLDAIVVASTQETGAWFHHAEKRKTPYVLIDRRFADLRANFVGIDDVTVGEMATEHLIEVGCRRIAHIRGPQVSTSLGRLEGYQRALVRRGLSPLNTPERFGGDVDSVERGREAMRQLLKLDPRPDGVFCFNDPTALGALSAIFAAGLRVPEDIAVIGCGNLHYDDALAVPLSSVDQQSTLIGQRAASLVLKLIQAKSPPQPTSVILEPEVVVRASTRRSPAPVEDACRQAGSCFSREPTGGTPAKPTV